jgi:hypothetical protein
VKLCARAVTPRERHARAARGGNLRPQQSSKAGAGTLRAGTRVSSAVQDFGLRSFEAGAATPGLGWSPIVDFSGHTENAGHLAQPTANAMGHKVMEGLLLEW